MEIRILRRRGLAATGIYRRRPEWAVGRSRVARYAGREPDCPNGRYRAGPLRDVGTCEVVDGLRHPHVAGPLSAHAAENV